MALTADTTAAAATTSHAVSSAGSGADEHVVPQATDTSLDAGFGRAIARGYLGGVIVIFAFVFTVMKTISDVKGVTIPLIVALGVAIWIGVLGGVVAVGKWAKQNEHELHGGTKH